MRVNLFGLGAVVGAFSGRPQRPTLPLLNLLLQRSIQTQVVYLSDFHDEAKAQRVLAASVYNNRGQLQADELKNYGVIFCLSPVAGSSDRRALKNVSLSDERAAAHPPPAGGWPSSLCLRFRSTRTGRATRAAPLATTANTSGAFLQMNKNEKSEAL